MWRFLRNRRLLLCLHTIFRALIYWAHRAVVLAIAWHLVNILLQARSLGNLQIAMKPFRHPPHFKHVVTLPCKILISEKIVFCLLETILLKDEVKRI